MTWATLLFLAVYVGLKAAQLTFRGRASGYHAPPVHFARRLKAGEPWLLIIAAAITVPPALAATWYHGHKFEAVLRHSVTCYGLIAAYQDEPAIKRSYRDYAVYEAFVGFRETALDAADQLGFSPGPTQRSLDDSLRLASTERAAATGGLRRTRLTQTLQCLLPAVVQPNA